MKTTKLQAFQRLRSSVHSNWVNQRGLAATSLAVLSLGVAGPATAGNKYWDASTSANLQAGDGNWDTASTALWCGDTGGTTLTTWANGDDAFFQFAAGTSNVTVNGASVRNITFDNGGAITHILAGTGSLTLTGNITAAWNNGGSTTVNWINSNLILNTSPTITFGRNYGDGTNGNFLQIGGAISETGGARKLTIATTNSGGGGNGTLYLDSANNSFSGGLDAGGRYVIARATSGTPLGTGNIDTRPGYTPTPVVPIQLQPATVSSGTNVVLSAANAAAGSRINLNGGGQFVLDKNGNNSLTFTVGNAGAAANSVLNRLGAYAAFVLQYTNTLGTNEKFIVNGGVTNINGMTTPYFSGLKGTVPDFLTYDATNGFKAASYDYTDTFTGSGSTSKVVLTAAKTLSAGSYAAHAVALRTGNLDLGGGTLTLGDGTNPAGLLINGNVNNGTLSVPAELAVTPISGAINAAVSGAGTLANAGSSTLTLGGNLSVANIAACAGTITLNVASPATQSISSVISASSAVLAKTGTGTSVLSSVGNTAYQLWPGNGTAGGSFVLDNSVVANPTLTLSGGITSMRNDNGTSPARFAMSAGTLTLGSDFRLSNDGTYSIATITGGTVNHTGGIVDVGYNSGRAVFNLGGTAVYGGGRQLRISSAYICNSFANIYGSAIGTFGDIVLGNSNGVPGTAQYGTLTLSGSATVTGTSMEVGNQSSNATAATYGLYNQSAGTASIDGIVKLANDQSSGTLVGIMNLFGGTLNARQVTSGTGTARLNFRGGTLACNSATSASTFLSLTATGAAYIYEGATINTGSYNVTIAQPLLAPTGKGVTAIPVTAGGSNCWVPPSVKIVRGAGDTTGTGASAVAVVNSSGVVTGITITSPGTAYTVAPVVTLDAGQGTTATLGTVTIGDNLPNASYKGDLTKLGSGTLTLSGTNTYIGTTSVNVGTLALSNTGSINSSTGIAIASGATFDVSAYASYALSSSVTNLTATSAGQSATIKGGSTGVTLDKPITLNYDGSNPALVVSQGALTLGSSQTITVNTANPLPAGTYNIVSVTGGSIVQAGTYTLAGTAGTGTIGFSGGLVQMNITSGGSLTTTTTSLSGADSKTFGTASTMSVTVSNSPGASGTVQFYVNGLTFGSPVTLDAGSMATIPDTSTLNAGSYTIAATYSGTATYQPSATTSSATLTVTKVTPTVTVTVGTYTYNGSAQGPTAVTFSPAGDTGAVTWTYVGTGGTTYNSSATRPTAAGTYTATALVAADTNNNTASSSATAFSIGKATPTVTVTVGSYTYNGSGQGPISVTTSPTSTGTVTWSYAGTGATTYGPGSIPPTAAGTYSATATVAADTNNNSASSTATAFTINKATPTVTVTVGSYTYSGSPQGPSAVTFSPVGDTGSVTWSYVGVSGTTYGPSATQPTNAGSYTATASVAADSNFNATSSSATAFAISKATPTVTVTVGTYTYSGSAQGPNAVTFSPTGDTGAVTWSYVGVTGTTYGPSATRPTLAGTYTATASVAADTNNNAAASSATAFAIDKVTPVVTVTGGTYTYSGLPQGPNAVTLNPPGDTGAVTWSYLGINTTTYGPSATRPSDMGDYTATATVAADSNFNAASSIATEFAIAKGSPAVTVVVGTYTYNELPQGPNTVSFDPPGDTGVVTWTYNGTGGTSYGPSATQPTAAGTYTAKADVAADANFFAASSSPTPFGISKADPTNVVWPTASAITLGQTLASSSLSGGSATQTGSFDFSAPATQPSTAGTTSASVTFTPTDSNYKTVSSTVSVTVNKAIPDVAVNVGTYTYSGLPQGPSSVTTLSTGAVTYSYSGSGYGPSATMPTATGDYTVTASVAEDSNYLSAASSATAFTIGKATLTVTAAGKERPVGKANPQFTYTITGYQNGENATSAGVTGTPTLSTDAITSSPTGAYTITCAIGSLGGAPNYSYTMANGTLTVFAFPNPLFMLDTDSFPASGNTGNWARTDPAGGTFTTIGTPTVDPVGTTPVKWEKNVYVNGTGYSGGTQAAAIPINGASIVTVIKPLRSSDTGNWRSIVDVLYDQFCLIIDNNTGRLGMRRGTGNGTGADHQWGPAGAIVPDQQSSVVSVVMASDGSYKMYVNGTLVWTYATTTTLTQFYRASLNTWGIGRNTFDGWTTFNGNIGDVYVSKGALSDASRQQWETYLMAKFHAGASYPNPTITASTSGGGGTISPSGSVSVPYESDQTFSVTTNYGYTLSLLVDGSAATPVVDSYTSAGVVSHYAFTDVAANHTIAANYTAIPTRTISGHVTAQAGGGATVSVKLTGSMLPSQQATTDTSGNYTMTVPEGGYYICASQTGYMISADTACNSTGDQVINFTLAAKRNIPKMENLLFAASTTDMGAVGTSGNWPLLYCTYPSTSTLTAIGSPQVNRVSGIKYDLNLNVDGDGYRLNNTMASSSISTSGASVVTVVKPVRTGSDNNWQSVVDIFRDNLILGVDLAGGKVFVRRNGIDFKSATAIPDGQLTMLSLVVQPDGQFKVWSSAWNGTAFDAPSVILSTTNTSAFTAFIPAQVNIADWARHINIGRNNGDGWATYNGYIGDTFVYKTALSDADRAILEADINTKITNPTHNITASAGAGGSITPSGVVAVPDGDNQSFTITADAGYLLAQVAVDGVNQGAITSYTFNNVATTHTIAATFVPNTRTLTYLAGPGGTISGTTPQTITVGSNGTQVQALPNTHYHFVSWSDDVLTASRTDTNIQANLTVTANFARPGITAPATLTAFTTTYGAVSAEQHFPVSGANLTADIVASAPSGFEVSNNNATYGGTATFTQSGGAASGTLYVRLAATAAVTGTYNSVDIALTSTDAVTVTVATAASGNTVSKADTTTAASNSPGGVHGQLAPVTLSTTVTANSPSAATVSEGTVTFTVKDAGNNTVGTATSGTLSGAAASQTFAIAALAAGTYSVSATYNPAASNPNFNTSTSLATGTLTIISNYQSWISTNYPSLTGDDALPGADPDHDGVINQMEYAFDTNPTNPASGPNAIEYADGVVTKHGQQPVTTLSRKLDDSVDYRAVFGRRKDYETAGLTYTVEYSADNTHFVPVAAAPADVSVVASDATIEAVSVPYPWFIPTSRGYEQPKFFRVGVSSN